MDAGTNLLQEDFKDTIYMEQREGFIEEKSKVCLLEKFMYGLKQSPRQQYCRFHELLLKHGFVRSITYVYTY